jgi:hypothetical protein
LGSLTTGGAWQNHPRIVEARQSQLEEIAKTAINFCNFLKEISDMIKKYEINPDKASFTLKFHPWTDAFGKYTVDSYSNLETGCPSSNFFLIHTDAFYLYEEKSKGKIRFDFVNSVNTK